ncbi:hypothetical protein FJ546_27360 [Mesorhizobium sp. B2-4-19]|uniref:hypothetical protein n=1 Tax=Mesorhizobium sp. B2-4-19 TaxID=2589930 RepID=UPI00112BA5CE|nr:hypothetical protein [Mesorhizobium sp. B2-4-19]TPK57347.1 hypothetical protein FJ546_27360 [Mesorhizobium sp. B2-4-19]
MWPYLKTTDTDKRTWLELFKPPFDPFVELVKQDGRELLLLKANSLSSIADSRDTYEAAKILVRQMNSVVVAMIGLSEVTVDGTCEQREGRLRCTVHLEPQSIHFRFGMGSPRLQVFDSSGKLIERPPEPSTAQKRIKVALAHEAISNALLYCGSDPDWFDLYKAFECLRDAELLGGHPTKNFTQTANAMFRHRQGKYDMPKRPMHIEEACRLVRSWISEAMDRLQ